MKFRFPFLGKGADMGDSKKGQGRNNPLKSNIKKLSENDPTRGQQIDEYEREIEKLQIQIDSMEEEVRQLRQARSQLEQAYRQNERLTAALQEAKNQMEALKLEVEKLTAPPSSYGIFSSLNTDGTATVFVSGRKMKVNLIPASRQRTQERTGAILNEV
jgi:proteasome-associated ATPase